MTLIFAGSQKTFEEGNNNNLYKKDDGRKRQEVH